MGTRRRSSFRSTTSDVVSVMSVPEPMATPTSACASAGESLTPSPTTMTSCSRACSFFTASTLSAGRVLDI